jgi:hypothetical protein
MEWQRQRGKAMAERGFFFKLEVVHIYVGGDVKLRI